MTSWAHKHRPWRKALRSLRHAVEGLLQFLLLGIFWILPVDWASNLGGWLTRQIGSRLPVSRRAMEHLPSAWRRSATRAKPSSSSPPIWPTSS